MRPDPKPSRFFTPLLLSRFVLTVRLVNATIYSAIAWQLRLTQFPSDSKSWRVNSHRITRKRSPSFAMNPSVCCLTVCSLMLRLKKTKQTNKQRNKQTKKCMWLNRLSVKPTFLVEKISGIFPGENYVPWNFPEKFNNVSKVICKIDKLNNKVNIDHLTNRPLMINS